jgi:nickel superoxide dismutase
MSTVRLGLVAALVVLVTASAFAHCEIPCGIYTDEMRIQMIEEHCQTIEKSMTQIVGLSADSGKAANQLTRWIINKEQHADDIQEIVTQYFMTQRIKPGQPQYEKKLVLLHGMLIEAMKCKQTTETSHVGKLRELLNDFSKLYFAH